MTDVIPGATYYDSVFEMRATCNGTTIDEGDRMVVLEYENVDEPITVEFDVFQESPHFEIDESSVP